MADNQNGKGKPFIVTGADGQPIVIPEGEWYMSTKARPRRLMRNSLSAEARQVYACLELATIGFRQELAVKMDKGKQVPLTPGDIGHQTGLSKQHVSRAFRELDDAGLAQRRSVDGGPLQKGNIHIYAWAIPRSIVDSRGSRARLPNPDWFVQFEALIPLVNRFKYKLPQDLAAADGYLEELAVAARDYQNAEKVACALLDRVCARPPSNKEERNCKEPYERNPPSSPSTNGSKREEAGRQADVRVESGLPACPPSGPQNNQEHQTPQTTRGDQILQLPAVQKLQHKLSDTIGPKLLREIVIQLGDSPLEDFDKRLRLKMESTKSLARLPSIASDVLKSHELQAVTESAEDKRMKKFQAWEAILNDPYEPEDVKQEVRLLLVKEVNT